MNLSIPQNFFADEEKNKLKELLKVSSDEEFTHAIGLIVLAALTEYKEMLLGKGLPTRADEIKQHRLFHLIKKYFNGKIPTEAEVSMMFQLTESESKSLIRNVRTRFRYQLENEISQTLKATVESSEQLDSKFQVVIQSDNVIEELNRIIATLAPNLDPITKVRGAARKYEISEDTYGFLCRHFGIEEDEDSEILA